MDEARAVLSRLRRIEALDRSGVPASTLLEQLRLLVGESEAWLLAEREPERARRALERCRAALEREQVPAAAR